MGSMLQQSRAVDIKSFKEVKLEIDIAEPLYQKQTKYKTQWKRTNHKMDTFSVVLSIVIFYSLLYIVDSLLRCLNFSATLIAVVLGIDAPSPRLKTPQFLPVQDMATTYLPCLPSVPGNTDIPWPGAH